MTRRLRLFAVFAVALVLGVGDTVWAQGAVPTAPPPPAAAAPGVSPQATICTTAYGWCPLQTVALPGAPCHCLAPPSTWVRGHARYWPYQGPASPYLNPHVAPPTTIR